MKSMPTPQLFPEEVVALVDETLSRVLLQIKLELIVLGLPDLLANGQMGSGDLADQMNPKQSAKILYRALRAIASGPNPIVEEKTPDVFGLTRYGELMRSNHPYSLKEYYTLFGQPFMQAPLLYLSDTLRTGNPAANVAFDESFWTHLKNNPDMERRFNDGMAARTMLETPDIFSYAF